METNNENWLLVKLKSQKQNLFLFIILGITLCLIIGLTVGIVLSQNSRDVIGSYRRAIDLLEKYPLVDGHNDIASMIRKNFQNQFGKFDFADMTPYRQFMSGTSGVSHTDIKRIREGHLGAQFWAAYASCESLYKDAPRIHMEQLDVIKRLFRKFPNDLEFVSNSQDILAAFNKKKVASLLGLESGHAIDSSLALLRDFYRLGIRYMTLTHNCDVPWATNHLVDRLSNSSSYGGLTEFGKIVIREMNRLGMMVDLSHTSRATMRDALSASKAPVMFSHSSVFNLCNNTRNVPDDVLLKLKENNGVIMINFYSEFLVCDGSDFTKTNVSRVVEHINYVKNLIGVDHVGIGSDFDGVPNTPLKIDDVSRYPNLITALFDDGWNEKDVVKLIYRNVVRVFSDVENYAREQARNNTQPIDDFLPIEEQPSTCLTNYT